MGIREEQKEKRREEILNAGLDLFVRKGYAATKIGDIAKQVGMSTGLMFHYFDSKEKLYEELIGCGITGPMQAIALVDDDPIVFFEKIAEQILSYITTDPFTAKMFVLMSHAFYNEAAPQSVKDLIAGFDIYTPTAALIEKGQKNGTIRGGNPFALAVAFWCSIQGIAEEMALHSHMPCPDSDWIVDILRRKA